MHHYSVSIRYYERSAETRIHLVSHGVRDGGYGDLWSRDLTVTGAQQDSRTAIRGAVLELLRMLEG